jgi:cytochrome c oxidase subunit 2
MQKIVRVVTQTEYQDWIANQKPYLTDAVKKELKMADVKSSGLKKISSNRLALNN